MAVGNAFYAYPGAYPLIRDAIQGASEIEISNGMVIKTWEAMNILGFKIDDMVRENIQKSDFLAADITKPNLNVYYEIGYAIALGKPVLPTLNSAISGASEALRKVGLFDTTGYASYTNANELAQKIGQWDVSAWNNKASRKRNFSQPLFILDCLKKTDFRNWIFQTAEDAKVKYRVYDPEEVPRFTAAQAYSEVSSSSGVIIPLLSKDIVDAELHNLRAGFILGIAHGCEIDCLVLQYGNGPAPLDYRDYIRNSMSRIETIKHVESYCQDTLVRNQKPAGRSGHPKNNILSRIDLGSSSAENEAASLDQYFVETAQFSRALRAEGAIVSGRKGSGKSAIYLQVLEKLRSSGPRSCVVDLRPASHDLSEMREALLSVLSAGVFDHTIAAFWQYIVYFEILLKLREMIIPRAKSNFGVQELIAELETTFNLNDQVVSGDFTSRLKAAVDNVVKRAESAESSDQLRGELTNFMFEKPIPALREYIIKLSENFDSIHILIDDLDKGWPPRRVENQDIMMVKHLIETLQKIRRDLAKKNINVSHLLFLRGDIYERLVERTSDRGKYNVINVDWSDPVQLENLLLVRVSTSVDEDEEEVAWQSLNPPMMGGDAFARMLSASLMRPRFLIDVCERTLSFAVNRGHNVVHEEDVNDAIDQMSFYLVSDFGYEMRDVAGTPEDIFYYFIGAPEKLSEIDLTRILEDTKLIKDVPEAISLLLWYGFLGISGRNGGHVFIYDRAYDFRRLEAERNSFGDRVEYVLNPAFLRGLQ